MEKFLIEKMKGGYYDRLNDDEIERAKKWGIDLLEETE